MGIDSRLPAFVTITLLAAVVGFSAGRITTPKSIAPVSNSVKQAGLFDSQTATINGKIVKVKGDKVTVEHKKGDSRDYRLDKSFTVIRYSESRAESSRSAGIKNIDLNKEGLINLVFKEEEYLVSSIGYLPPPPPPPKINPAAKPVSPLTKPSK